VLRAGTACCKGADVENPNLELADDWTIGCDCCCTGGGGGGSGPCGDRCDSDNTTCGGEGDGDSEGGDGDGDGCGGSCDGDGGRAPWADEMAVGA
jgi:hypothetical protein